MGAVRSDKIAIRLFPAENKVILSWFSPAGRNDVGFDRIFVIFDTGSYADEPKRKYN